jgi:uncharacterized membrane protein
MNHLYFQRRYDMFALIYIVGLVIAYIILRKYNKWDRSWEAVITCFVFSLFSWIIVLFTAIIFLFNFLNKKFKDTEPPKWL